MLLCSLYACGRHACTCPRPRLAGSWSQKRLFFAKSGSEASLAREAVLVLLQPQRSVSDLCLSGAVLSLNSIGMDTLGIKPRAFRMRSGCDTTMLLRQKNVQLMLGVFWTSCRGSVQKWHLDLPRDFRWYLRCLVASTRGFMNVVRKNRGRVPDLDDFSVL